jgi:hypothetical protein
MVRSSDAEEWMGGHLEEQLLEEEMEETQKTQRKASNFAKQARELEQRRMWQGEDGSSAGKGKLKMKKALRTRRTRKGSVLGAAAGVAAAAPVQFTGPLEVYGAPDVRVHVADLVGIVQGALSEQRTQRAFCRAGGAAKARAAPDYADDF